MRQYAWYSPELDVLIFQIIMDGCYISFEFSSLDAIDICHQTGNEIDPIYCGTWVPLGEL